jgi:hypothetical protein
MLHQPIKNQRRNLPRTENINPASRNRFEKPWAINHQRRNRQIQTQPRLVKRKTTQTLVLKTQPAESSPIALKKHRNQNDRKQETQQREIVPAQTGRVSLKDKLRRKDQVHPVLPWKVHGGGTHQTAGRSQSQKDRQGTRTRKGKLDLQTRKGQPRR